MSRLLPSDIEMYLGRYLACVSQYISHTIIRYSYTWLWLSGSIDDDVDKTIENKWNENRSQVVWVANTEINEDNNEMPHSGYLFRNRYDIYAFILHCDTDATNKRIFVPQLMIHIQILEAAPAMNYGGICKRIVHLSYYMMITYYIRLGNCRLYVCRLLKSALKRRSETSP